MTSLEATQELHRALGHDGRTGHGVDDLAAGRLSRQFDQVGDDRVVELVEGRGAFVEFVVAGGVRERRGRGVHARSQAHDRRVTQQVERASRQEVGVTGTESDDADDGGHL